MQRMTDVVPGAILRSKYYNVPAAVRAPQVIAVRLSPSSASEDAVREFTIITIAVASVDAVLEQDELQSLYPPPSYITEFESDVHDE